MDNCCLNNIKKNNLPDPYKLTKCALFKSNVNITKQQHCVSYIKLTLVFHALLTHQTGHLSKLHPKICQFTRAKSDQMLL